MTADRESTSDNSQHLDLPRACSPNFVKGANLRCCQNALTRPMDLETC